MWTGITVSGESPRAPRGATRRPTRRRSSARSYQARTGSRTANTLITSGAQGRFFEVNDPSVFTVIGQTLGDLYTMFGRDGAVPPLIVGRKERGLVAASCFTEDGARRLYTAAYSAERTGTSLSVEHGIAEEGQAPPDRFPRVMQGVVRRSEIGLGEPRMVEIAGDPAKLRALLDEFDVELLEPVET